MFKFTLFGLWRLTKQALESVQIGNQLLVVALFLIHWESHRARLILRATGFFQSIHFHEVACECCFISSWLKYDRRQKQQHDKKTCNWFVCLKIWNHDKLMSPVMKQIPHLQWAEEPFFTLHEMRHRLLVNYTPKPCLSSCVTHAKGKKTGRDNERRRETNGSHRLIIPRW